MNSNYNRLIRLAEDLYAPFNDARTIELNELLAATSAADVDPEHFSLLDSLISTISGTGNLSASHETAIIKLLEDIRSRAAA